MGRYFSCFGRTFPDVISPVSKDTNNLGRYSSGDWNTKENEKALVDHISQGKLRPNTYKKELDPRHPRKYTILKNKEGEKISMTWTY